MPGSPLETPPASVLDAPASPPSSTTAVDVEAGEDDEQPTATAHITPAKAAISEEEAERMRGNRCMEKLVVTGKKRSNTHAGMTQTERMRRTKFAYRHEKARAKT